MKKLLLTALFAPMMALAQTFPAPTFSSLTLQNPLTAANGGTGATSSTGSGSVVLSGSPTIANPAITGSFTATGLVTPSDISTQAANSILANATSSAASPTAIVMPSCSAAGSYLGWTSASGFGCTSAYPANVINYGAGINPLSGVALPVSLFGETAGSEYVAGGGLTVTDSTSHAGIGHTAYSFSSNPIGTGAIGPLNADFAATFSVLKQNFSASPTAGEVDGAYFVSRNGGSNSDTTGALFDVGNYGTGFNAAWEGNTTGFTSGVVTQQVDTQAGVVDTRTSHQYGYVASKVVGSGSGVAYYASNIDTSGGTGKWQHLLQFGGGGFTGFDMPISTSDVVSMQMFDGVGGSKTIGVLSNCYYIENAALTTQLLSLCDNGNLTNSGTFSTGALTATTGSFTTLNASANDALLYTNTGGQSIANNSATTVTGWTKTYDRVNTNFNASTGTFTAPATGYYLVSVQIAFAAAATGAGNQYSVTILNNGSVAANGQYFAETATSLIRVVRATAVLAMTSGQTITVQAYQASGSAIALSTTANVNTLSITRIP
ncbi:C1q-like domain-containing protein [Paraburkholderia unamae]|uniref:C1q domain-containing protein n=1 Tax=Paraburkholderia unamae TaxID=219649 RepID=A0ABX5K8N7_9BURK|nr:hypothetical protein [Paraburkholderia unamae]PVX61224.1 C1q domain-containing protein [Paraburkholderia unamae]